MNLMLPFCSKNLPDGKRLFRRKHGYTFTLDAEGDTVLEITVPYTHCKIQEADLVWFPEGVTAQMKVLDTAAGTYSGTPNYVFNEYGVNIAIAKDYFVDKSPYDADVYGGMILQITFNNPTATTKTVGMNVVFHEVLAAA